MKDTHDGQWFLDRLPPLDSLGSVLGSDPVSGLLGVARDRAPVELGLIGEPDNPANDPQIAALFALATGATKKLEQDPDAALSDEEKEALHLFVHLVGRPALRTNGGKLLKLPPTWPALKKARGVIEDLIQGVGRLDGPNGDVAGTGWFVAAERVITNNHVVAILCGLDVFNDLDWRAKLDQVRAATSATWEADAAKRPHWNAGDAPPWSGLAGRVRSIVALHDTHDAALLEVVGVPHSRDLALPLSGAAPEPAGTPVYLAGYPAAYRNATSPVVLDLLFGGASSVVSKRVCPGKLLGAANETHDASTLGGNSGSPVIAFGDHRVRGLHYGGTYGTANYCVPFSALVGDPFLADEGVELPTS
ncbi:MAG: trypsin-like peptidase domain-containing protein [Sandaracinaceae bacterium]|nr:trypsin-like peptidase domain-containing protein [Sandaracinaceae bacterium]